MWTIFKTSLEQPFFEYEGRKYFCSFDFPHLIKRLLTQLRKHKLLYDNVGKIIANFDDFKKTWEYDKLSSSQLLSHITDMHMNPSNWEVINVQRDFQFFSKRFSTAIIVAGEDPKSGF